MNYLMSVLLTLPLIMPTPLMADSTDDFQPCVKQGWKLLSKTPGDINNDGITDLVLIIEENDSNKVIKNDHLGPKNINTNLRELVVLFGGENGYKKIFSRNNLLPSEGNTNSTCSADPLADGGVYIKNNKLIINLLNWSSCGSWEMSSESFTFRKDEGNDFDLIGYDKSSVSRNTGEEQKTSINYLTKKKKITTDSNESEAESQKVIWSKIQFKGKLKLSTVELQCFNNHVSGCNWNI